MYPQIEERLIPVNENQDYESEYAAEICDFDYQNWASKQEFISLVKSLSALDLPSAQHIEDIEDISTGDLNSIVSGDQSSHSNNITTFVPELLVSNSPSPPEYPINRTAWGNADDIPTRVSSAILEEFPPLVRCRDGPAMGYSDDYIIDLEEAMLSDWSVSCFLNGDYDERYENDSDTESGSITKEKEGMIAERKDGEDFWAFISPASSTIPLRSPGTDTLHYYEREL